MSEPRTPLMHRSVRHPARPERMALVVLAVLACVLAHEATYIVTYGGGATLATAMSASGHDGYWSWLVAAVTAATVGLLLVTGRQLVRLHREAAAAPTNDDRDGVRDYLRLAVPIWVWLALIAVALYTLQENAEAIAAGLPLQGIDVVLRHGLLPLILILLTTLLVALVAALVHWRRLVLLGRLARPSALWTRAQTRRRRRPGELSPVQSGAPRGHGCRAPPVGRSLSAVL